MRHRFLYPLILFLIISDLFIINASFAASFLMTKSLGNELVSGLYKDFLIVYNLLWMLCAATFRLYTFQTLRNLDGVFRSSVTTVVTQQILWMAYFLFTKDFTYSRQFLLYIILFLSIGLTASRFLLTIFDIYYRRYIKFRTNVAIVGFNPTGVKLAEYFARHKQEYQFRGFLDETGKNFPLQSGLAGEYMEELLNKAHQKNINEVFAAISPTQLKDVRRMIEVADGLLIKLRLVPDLSGAMALTRFQVQYLDNLPVLGMRREPLEESGSRFKKRLLDLVMGLFRVTGIRQQTGKAPSGALLFVNNKNALVNHRISVEKLKRWTA